MKKGIVTASILTALAGLLTLLVVLLPKLQVAKESISLGSVTGGNEYFSTTTHSTFPLATVIKTGSGTLGSVIVTGGPSSGIFTLYDATTTNVTLRNNVATTSMILATFPTSVLDSTYVFDTVFNRGLLVDFSLAGGSIATTTITYR